MRLWSAQAVSAFGSRITRTALPIIAVNTLGASETLIAVLVALNLAPGVIVATFAGGVVDRGRKRHILIGADVFRAAVVVSLTIAWAFGALSIGHAIAVGALVGGASALFQITDVAYLPTLLGKADLADGNAKLETTEAIAEITGPASAGVLIAALGAPLAVVIDAATYVWSAVMLARIRTADEPATLAAPERVILDDLRVGLRLVFRQPQVRSIVLAQMFASVEAGFFAALYALYCLRVLGLDEATFGLVIMMGGIGALLGTQLARPIRRVLGIGPTILLAATISLAGALFIPLARGPYAVKLACLAAHQLLSDGWWMVFVIHSVTLRQTVLPKEMLGRANAAIYVVGVGLMPVAALVAGELAALTSIRFAVWVGVSIGVLGSLCLLPLRRVRDVS